jgi:hypothetical protein
MSSFAQNIGILNETSVTEKGSHCQIFDVFGKRKSHPGRDGSFERSLKEMWGAGGKLEFDLLKLFTRFKFVYQAVMKLVCCLSFCR